MVELATWRAGASCVFMLDIVWVPLVLFGALCHAAAFTE
jgi:hypothetical protein